MHAHEKRRIQEVCSRIVLKLTHRHLDVALEQRRMQEVCSRIVLKLTHQHLDVASLLLDVVLLMHRHIDMTFGAWREHASKQQRAERTCARVLKPWTHRWSAISFET